MRRIFRVSNRKSLQFQLHISEYLKFNEMKVILQKIGFKFVNPFLNHTLHKNTAKLPILDSST